MAIGRWICDDCYNKIGKEVECFTDARLGILCECCEKKLGVRHVTFSDAYLLKEFINTRHALLYLCSKLCSIDNGLYKGSEIADTIFELLNIDKDKFKSKSEKEAL